MYALTTNDACQMRFSEPSRLSHRDFHLRLCDLPAMRNVT